MKKFLILLMLMASPLVAFAQLQYISDRAVATNPFTGGMVPLSYAQVRVCTVTNGLPSPCPNVAQIYDLNGNPYPTSLGYSFGQLQTDVLGRFNFACTTDNYNIQIQASGNNTPSLNYILSCPGNVSYISTNNTWTGVNTFIQNIVGNLLGNVIGNVSANPGNSITIQAGNGGSDPHSGFGVAIYGGQGGTTGPTTGGAGGPVALNGGQATVSATNPGPYAGGQAAISGGAAAGPGGVGGPVIIQGGAGSGGGAGGFVFIGSSIGGYIELGGPTIPTKIDNVVSYYNGAVTAGNGAPVIRTATDATGQSTNIGTTILLASGFTSGMYRITAYIVVTTPATTSSTMPAVNLSWNDGNNTGTAETLALTTTSNGNALTTFAQGTAIINADTGTNISFSTTGYASTGATAMQYAIHLRIEAL